MTTVRNSVVMSFGIDDDRLRTLRLPDPAPGIDAAGVTEAAGSFVAAGIFETPLRRFVTASLESVETRVILGHDGT